MRNKCKIRKILNNIPVSKGFSKCLVSVTSDSEGTVTVVSEQPHSALPKSASSVISQSLKSQNPILGQSLGLGLGLSQSPSKCNPNINPKPTCGCTATILETPSPLDLPSLSQPLIDIDPSESRLGDRDKEVKDPEDIHDIREVFQQGLQHMDEYKERELKKFMSDEERKTILVAISSVKDNINYQLKLYEDIRRGEEIIKQLRVDQEEFHKKLVKYRTKFINGYNGMIRLGLVFNQSEYNNMKNLNEDMIFTSEGLEKFFRRLDIILSKHQRRKEVLSAYCKDMHKRLNECDKYGKTLSFEQFKKIGLPKPDWKQMISHRKAVDNIRNEWNQFEAHETIKIGVWYEMLDEIYFIFAITSLRYD